MEDLQIVQYGHKACPACGAGLVGERIPYEIQATREATHYSRLIPKVEGLVCPKCRIVVEHTY